MKYEWWIGFRYLKAKQKTTFINVITIISIGGVTLGVAALLIVISVMNGFDSDLRDKILSAKSHLVIEDFSGIENYQKIIENIDRDPNVIASSPVIMCKGLINSAGIWADGVLIKGIFPRYERKVTDADNTLVAGSFAPLESECDKAFSVKSATGTITLDQLSNNVPGVIIGKELAKNLFNLFPFGGESERDVLKSAIGRRVRLISPHERETPTGRVPVAMVLKVVGVFDTGYYEWDSTLVMISLPTAQRFNKLSDVVSRIEVSLKNMEKVIDTEERLRSSLMEEFQRYYLMQNWMEMNRTIFQALQLEKTVMFIILVLIILVAAFNIISTLIMVVMDKTREIGILMAMGATRKSIRKIFLLEGVIIGVSGTVLGLLIGILGCVLISFYEIPMPGGGEVYYVNTLPVQMRLMDFLLVSVFTIIICILAAWYPARYASKLQPTEALRYE